MFWRTRPSGAAVNALMAEKTLSLIELVPQNSFALKLKNAAIDVIRLCWELATDDVARAREFDLQDRFVQLNLLAYAFTALGTPANVFKRQPLGIHYLDQAHSTIEMSRSLLKIATRQHCHQRIGHLRLGIALKRMPSEQCRSDDRQYEHNSMQR